MENLNQLKILAEVFDTDKIITGEDTTRVLEAIVKLLSNFKQDNEELNKDTKRQVESALEGIFKEFDKVLSKVENTSQNAISEATEAVKKISDKLDEVKRLANEVMEMKPKDGEDGMDADEEKIIEEVLSKIKLPENKEFLLTGEDIVDNINALSLEPKNQIDASHIKNLPTPKGGYSPTVLGNATDLNQAARADGYAIVWDDTNKNFKFASSGGGSGDQSAIQFQDEGSNLGAAGTVDTLDFVGAGVSAARVGNKVTVTVAGGGGSGTVTSVAATVPAGLTISGSPITTTGTLAIGLDTGYVIPLQSTLDGKLDGTLTATRVPFASDSNTLTDDAHFYYNSTTDILHVHGIAGDATDGLLIESEGGTDIGILGAANTANVTWYGAHNFSVATQDTIAAFTGAGKTLGSLSLSTYPSLTELSYVKGVTSAIQTQLNAKQASDAQLTSLAGLSYTGNALKVIRVNAGETDFELATVSGSPAGSNTQIQFNNSGSFGASSGLTWDDATDTLGLGVDATIQSAGVLTLNAGGDGNYVEIYGKNATSTNNSGGDVYIATGTGDGSGSGGLFSLSGGNGGATGNGGNSQIVAGSGGLTSGNGGSLNLKAGFAQAGNGNGGSIQMYTGDKDGSGTAGEFRFYEGVASSVYGVLNFKSVATTSKTFTFPNTTGTVALVTGTSDTITVGTIELGAASDTTLSRASAGVLAVEGVTVPTISSTNTLTNKRITKRVGTTTSSATPTINTDNVDYYSLTAQTADITSFTTNLSGTPTDAQTLWISITGTAARAITWGASFESSTVTLPTTTVSTDRLDVGFVWNAATSKWRCVAKC